MASMFPRMGLSKRQNSKIFNLNPSVSGKDHSEPDLEPESRRKSARASKAPEIAHKSSNPGNTGCYSGFASGTSKQGVEFQHPGGLENQSLRELENYAVLRAKDTTRRVNGCLKVAEAMSGGASKLLVRVHQQGEQIMQAHRGAATIDHVLKRGEKLLNSLGGLFSRRWKPRKSQEIKGPALAKDDSFRRKVHCMEQRQRLGLAQPSLQSKSHSFRSKPASALEKIEMEKAKQDDALTELSSLLVKLKEMAVDMGSEIDRQNKSLDHMQADVNALNFRMEEANIRARHLLRG